MDHVAIMKKSWGLIPKVLKGEKKIESRWGINKSAPWGKVSVGDTVYFKNSGEPVIASAGVSRVLEFSELTPVKIKDLVSKYGGVGKISFSSSDAAISWAKDKKYCTLVFLKNPKKVKPFNIDKKGFGMGAAWLAVGDINKIKLSS